MTINTQRIETMLAERGMTKADLPGLVFIRCEVVSYFIHSL